MSFFGEAFGGAASDVVDGGLVESHSYDGEWVERSVGLSVSASVEAVPAGLCGRRWDGAGAAEFPKRRLRSGSALGCRRTR